MHIHLREGHLDAFLTEALLYALPQIRSPAHGIVKIHPEAQDEVQRAGTNAIDSTDIGGYCMSPRGGR